MDKLWKKTFLQLRISSPHKPPTMANIRLTTPCIWHKPRNIDTILRIKFLPVVCPFKYLCPKLTFAGRDDLGLDNLHKVLKGLVMARDGNCYCAIIGFWIFLIWNRTTTIFIFHDLTSGHCMQSELVKALVMQDNLWSTEAWVCPTCP